MMTKDTDRIHAARMRLDVAAVNLIAAEHILAVEPENALEHSLKRCLTESLRLVNVAQNHLEHLSKIKTAQQSGFDRP